MAQTDTSNFDAVLKEYYEGGIRELIPNKVRMYDRFRNMDANDWAGRRVTFPLHVGRNEGVGAYAEGATVPQAGFEQHVDVDIPMRYLGTRVSFTTQAIRSSQSSKGAFASAMDMGMRSAIRNLTAELGRIVWYDGRGVLALVNTDPTTGTTVTVDSPGGVAGATNGARFLRTNQLITFVSPTTGAIVGSADETITAVAAAGTSVTIGSAANTNIADNDYIVRANVAGLTDVSQTSYAKEPVGLLGLVDDGTYLATLHGVNRTTYPIWASSVISSVGAISGDVIQRGLDIADQRSNGNVNLLACHPSVRRAYIQAHEDQRRYTGADLSNPDLGTRAAKQRSLTFGEIEMETDKYAPFGMLFGVDTATLKRYVQIPGEWMDEDGAVLRPTGSGSTLTDAFEAFYRMWLNFSLEEPASCFRLDGITATVVTVHLD